MRQGGDVRRAVRRLEARKLVGKDARARALGGREEVCGRVQDCDGYGEGGREAQGRRAVLEGAGLRPEGAGAVGGEEEEEGEEGERMEGEGRRTSGARDGNTAGEEPWLGLGREAV